MPSPGSRMTRLFPLLALLCGLAAALPARAEPAMWVAKDADSTVYFIGTFHLLPAESDWRSPKIAAAFAASEELWLEVTGLDDALLMQNLVINYGLDPKNPLWRKLNETERRQMTAAVAAIGMPWVGVQPFRPWLAALTISTVPAIQAGFEIESGADASFEQEAIETDKPVKAFETVEEQISILASLSPEGELDFLRMTLADIESGKGHIDEMVAMWAKGDVAAIDRMIIGDMRTRVPEFYDAMIVRRNRAWTERIVEILAGSGTHFVAVGAAHLVGSESVPAMLEAHGIQVTRH